MDYWILVEDILFLIVSVLGIFIGIKNYKRISYLLVFLLIIYFISFIVGFSNRKLTFEKTEKHHDITDTINQKAKDILFDVNETLSYVNVINDSVKKLNNNLSKVNDSIAKQLNLFNITLTQTKEFQRLVDEQLKIEKDRFEFEKANIIISASDVEISKTLEERLSFFSGRFKNEGKRKAIDFKFFVLYMLMIDEHINDYSFEIESFNKGVIINPNRVLSFKRKIENSLLIEAKGGFVFIWYQYKDVFSDSLIQHNKYFISSNKFFKNSTYSDLQDANMKKKINKLLALKNKDSLILK